MTNPLTETLDKVIKQAALDGTFTNESVGQFHQLVEDYDLLKKKAVALERELKQTKRDKEQLESKARHLEKECETWAAREQDVLDREKKADVLDNSLVYEKLRVTDHQNMVGMIFRNSVLRREVMTPIDATPITDGGMQGQPGHAQRDTVEEEKQ